jgi:hypothetical protein
MRDEGEKRNKREFGGCGYLMQPPDLVGVAGSCLCSTHDTHGAGATFASSLSYNTINPAVNGTHLQVLRIMWSVIDSGQLRKHQLEEH